jgi:large subunit ribosomal protein L23
MGILKCDESSVKISHFSIIKGFIATEKSFNLKNVNSYCFKVDQSSTKQLIKSSVESLFSVKVKSVNVLNTAEKEKKFKGRPFVKKGFKKAYVTLLEGSKIDID